MYPWNKGLKGYGIFNKGRKLTQEHKRKLSFALKGRTAWNKGKKMPIGMGEKISKIRKEMHIVPKTAFKKGHVPRSYIDGRSKLKNLGMGHPKGINHWRWRGGEEKGISHHWNSFKWIKIRKKILIRDNYTCQECFGKGYEVHHKIPYRICKHDKEDNLITVCRSCHVTLENNIDFRRIDNLIKQNNNNNLIVMEA